MKIVYKELTHKMNKLDCYKRYVMHKSLRDSGVYFGQPPILDCLKKHRECTQKELSDETNVSPASVAVSVKRMQKNGLVTKISDENDLRCNRIALTDEGVQRMEYIHRIFDKMDERLFSGFSEDELSALDNYFDRMIANISTEVPDEEKNDIFKIMKEEMKSHAKGGDDNG